MLRGKLLLKKLQIGRHNWSVQLNVCDVIGLLGRYQVDAQGCCLSDVIEWMLSNEYYRTASSRCDLMWSTRQLEQPEYWASSWKLDETSSSL